MPLARHAWWCLDARDEPCLAPWRRRLMMVVPMMLVTSMPWHSGDGAYDRSEGPCSS
jgi:hypothetical protein